MSWEILVFTAVWAQWPWSFSVWSISLCFEPDASYLLSHRHSPSCSLDASTLLAISLQIVQRSLVSLARHSFHLEGCQSNTSSKLTWMSAPALTLLCTPHVSNKGKPDTNSLWSWLLTCKLVLAAVQNPSKGRSNWRDVQAYLCHWQQTKQRGQQLGRLAKNFWQCSELPPAIPVQNNFQGVAREKRPQECQRQQRAPTAPVAWTPSLVLRCTSSPPRRTAALTDLATSIC